MTGWRIRKCFMDWAALLPFVGFSGFWLFSALFSAILRPDKKHRMLMIKITMMKNRILTILVLLSCCWLP